MLCRVWGVQNIIRRGCNGVAAVQPLFRAKSNTTKKQRKYTKVGDIHTTTVIDEMTMEQYLSPEKKSLLQSLKQKYVNWNSEFNIKRKMKGFKPEEVYEELPDMFLQLHEFFAHNQIAFASKVLIPPLMKEMKELHPAVFSTKQLEPFHINLACVGYSLSYLDATPELLQARVLQGKDVMYAQLTVGVRAVEDIYGWTSRGKRVTLLREFPVEIPSIGGYELPLDSIRSRWLSSEDSEHRTYYYNSATRVSAWSNPEEYVNRRKYRAYLCVIERPLLLSMGNWRFHKINFFLCFIQVLSMLCCFISPRLYRIQ